MMSGRTNSEMKKQLKEMIDWISKLDERDTEKQAFVQLAGAIPNLPPNLVQDVYIRLERNKDPILMSTRENVLLLIEILCKTQPTICARLVKRITAYLNYRLRDKRTKVTDACVVAASALALYVLPSLPETAIDLVVQPFLKETNIMTDGAARCLGVILHPITTDLDLLKNHESRTAPYLITFLPLLMAKFHSSVYATYSPIFHILHRIVLLVKDVPGTKELQKSIGDHLLPMISAIDAVLRCGQRDDWLNRKRALDLAGVLVNCFPAHDVVQTQKSTLMQIAQRGRSDYASPVRDSAAVLLKQLGPLTRSGSLRPEAMDAAYNAMHPHRPHSPEPHLRTMSASSPTKQSTSPQRIIKVGDTMVRELPTPTQSNNQTTHLSEDFAENMRIAMEEGDMELALRIALVSEDNSLIRRLLTFSKPLTHLFKPTTLNALCSSFLDFLDTADEATIIFPWISCLLKYEINLSYIDDRVLRHLGDMLFTLSALPSKEGLIAARLHQEIISRTTE
ncbi:hypothetical protein THRCLA_03512 [Thraustotheca clavata]|uniref:TORTIFOLIA1/SINE1-2 N-terminal domain-containing protein n=1 Tax=Thraustotheca clavata TaxID=74557 RepID=A0A1W0A1V9_9STRA|nr:hypothetical protein THRCLA_03512 [Thraustotheca clavata]